MANIHYIRGKIYIINSYTAIPIKHVLTVESRYGRSVEHHSLEAGKAQNHEK